jgi:hypothetical protein
VTGLLLVVGLWLLYVWARCVQWTLEANRRDEERERAA